MPDYATLALDLTYGYYSQALPGSPPGLALTQPGSAHPTPTLALVSTRRCWSYLGLTHFQIQHMHVPRDVVAMFSLPVHAFLCSKISIPKETKVC